MNNLNLFKRIYKDVARIIFRNVFILINIIIFGVVVLLVAFGDKESALFIAIFLSINMLLGIVQDVHSRIALERLQFLTAVKSVRLNKDGTEELLMSEEIQKGDFIKLKLGDQVPCDGVLSSTKNLEVSNALLTGESEAFPKKDGDRVDGGAIIAAGVGILEVQKVFAETQIFRINEGAQKYFANPSPIQKATNTIIKYTGYILLVVLTFVVVRGYFVHEPTVNIVLNIGALASTIVPQGLIVITTLLFALGAASYSKKHVFFQEINATEKLGRIKNLCMDKTGTLTDNILSVEEMYLPPNITREDATKLVAVYMEGSGDSSETMSAVKKYLGDVKFTEKIIEAASFSSWRQYGAVSIEGPLGKEMVLIGSPGVLIPSLKDGPEKKWMQGLIDTHSFEGKRLLCVLRSSSTDVSLSPEALDLKVVAVFVFKYVFREGIQKAVSFFQDRGIRIRILSGDNPQTVRAVAALAGVAHTEATVTGVEMAKWSDADFDREVDKYTIFAQIVPEQKIKIILALKKNGFTAMVGDGVNDALAIKNADLGIAMFAGAPVTRRLASIILVENSFTDLPGGVELADNFIKNIETIASLYINQSTMGLFFFIIISFFGYAYPLTPLNMLALNYFTVGAALPVMLWWAASPVGKTVPATSESFLKRIMPFIIWSAIVEAIAAAVVFAVSFTFFRGAPSNTLVALAFLVSGFIFLINF